MCKYLRVPISPIGFLAKFSLAPTDALLYGHREKGLVMIQVCATFFGSLIVPSAGQQTLTISEMPWRTSSCSTMVLLETIRLLRGQTRLLKKGCYEWWKAKNESVHQYLKDSIIPTPNKAVIERAYGEEVLLHIIFASGGNQVLEYGIYQVVCW
jgi:hypothetical protein